MEISKIDYIRIYNNNKCFFFEKKREQKKGEKKRKIKYLTFSLFEFGKWLWTKNLLYLKLKKFPSWLYMNLSLKGHPSILILLIFLLFKFSFWEFLTVKLLTDFFFFFKGIFLEAQEQQKVIKL